MKIYAKKEIKSTYDQLKDIFLKGMVDIRDKDKFQKFIDANVLFKNKYSLSNILLITRQNPDAELVASRGDWEKSGYKLKENAKGIYIYFPIVLKKEEEEKVDKELPDTGEALKEDPEKKQAVKFYIGKVYDVSEVERNMNLEQYDLGVFKASNVFNSKYEIKTNLLKLIKMTTGINIEESMEGDVLVYEGLKEIAKESFDSESNEKIKDLKASIVAYVLSKIFGASISNNVDPFKELDSLKNIQNKEMLSLVKDSMDKAEEFSKNSDDINRELFTKASDIVSRLEGMQILANFSRAGQEREDR